MTVDVVRTRALPEQADCFADTSIDGYRVRNRFLIGAASGPLKAGAVDVGLYVELLTCPASERLGEHRHPHTEALFALDGHWTISWRASQDDEPTKVHAEPWDLIRIPAGHWLAATHGGDGDAHLLVIAGITKGNESAP